AVIDHCVSVHRGIVAVIGHIKPRSKDKFVSVVHFVFDPEIDPVILIDVVLSIALMIYLARVRRQDILSSQMAHPFIGPVTVVITPVHLEFFEPFIVKLDSDAVGIDDAILSPYVILAIGISRIGYRIDVVAHSRHRDALIIVEEIDVGSELVMIIGSIARGSSSKSGFFTVGLGNDIDRPRFIPVIESTEFCLITFLVKNLYFVNDFSWKAFQSQFDIVSKK